MRNSLFSIMLAFFVAGGSLAFGDAIALVGGEIVMGRVARYEEGVFFGDFAGSGKTSLRSDEVKRIAFSSGCKGTLTTTAGKTGTFPMVSFEEGRFVCMKSPVETASIQGDRVSVATFASAPLPSVTAVSSTGSQSYRTSTTTSSPRTSGSSYSSSSRSHYGGGSSSRSTYYGGRVWVDGYYRADGTWVEGHWREAPGMGTSSHSGYSGGSTYVHGYYRKDGTYVHGHTRKK